LINYNSNWKEGSIFPEARCGAILKSKYCMEQKQKLYKSIEHFYSKTISDQIFLESAYEGCSSNEIKDIELHLNYNLPITIKEFLSFCGKKWKGTYVLDSLQKNLLDKTSYQILEDSKLASEVKQGLSQIDINEIIIVDFEEHAGDYHWSFFYRKNKKKDPDIHFIFYEILNKDCIPFTQYIENKLDTAKSFVNDLSITYSDRFELKTSYINPSAVKILHIQSHELALEASELIMKFSQLEELSFGNFNSYPEQSWIFNVPHHPTLKKLSIFRDELKELSLPKEGLPNLETLLIYSQNLVEFPKNLSSCTNLTKLSIREGNFNILSKEIFKLYKLKEVSINNFLQKEFPIELSVLKNLVTISLNGNLQVFPEGLYSIPSITKIDLSNNIISSIDERIKNISNLKELNINQNSFSAIELERLENMLPTVKIVHYNQKPYVKSDANPSWEFQIIFDEKIAKKYLSLLDAHNLYFIKAVTNYTDHCLITNKYDYQNCIDLLDKIKKNDNQEVVPPENN